MAKILEMPKLSPTMEEGQLSAWRKNKGDSVAVDDLLAEVETDKATMEYRSFDKGTLLEILVPAGSVVKLGQPVAILGAAGEDVSALLASIGKGGSPAPAAKPAAATSADAGKGANAADSAPSPTQESPAVGGRVKASPYVRKLARERGLSLTGVAGSGPHGRIVARDLSNIQAPQTPLHAPAAAPAPAPATANIAPPAIPAAPGTLAAPEVKPLSMMRKAIARRLTESKQTVPHFYLTIDVDADALHHLREQVNADLLASHGEGAAKVSFNDLVIKAAALALRKVPACNARYYSGGSGSGQAGPTPPPPGTPEAILIHQRVDISVAVAVPDGLVTPVVRDADKKGVLAIAAEVRALAARAKDKKLLPEEMQQGTFSISNLGMYGIDAFAAVINPPEGAILAVGQVRREPVVVGEAVVPGRRMAMTLSCDHRVVDGAVGASFLKELRKILEHPTQILLG